MRLRYVLNAGYFPFLVGHGKDSDCQKGTKDSDHSENLSFREHGSNQRRLALRVVPDEEFLHTKINSKDVYVDYGAT